MLPIRISASWNPSLMLDMTQPAYPPWLRALRFLLSTTAVLSLLATIFCILTLGVRRHASDYLQDLSTDAPWISSQNTYDGRFCHPGTFSDIRNACTLGRKEDRMAHLRTRCLRWFHQQRHQPFAAFSTKVNTVPVIVFDITKWKGTVRLSVFSFKLYILIIFTL
jgi:hypothetical protein